MNYSVVVMLAAGTWLLVLAIFVNAQGLHNAVLFKLMPVIIAAACLFVGAAMFMGRLP